MAVARKVLLWCSENRWMRRKVPSWWFVKRAVRRFMPGEDLSDALSASAGLNDDGIGVVLTQLGENVVDAAAADGVAHHYRDVVLSVKRQGLDCCISVKPTQLGLDLAESTAGRHLIDLAAAAAEHGSVIWVDMEQSPYVEQTLRLVRVARREVGPIGVCLQAYLRRTAADLELLLDEGVAVRLVKGAYREPADVAFPDKAEVDRNYLALAKRMLQAEQGMWAGRGELAAAFATHDGKLIEQIRTWAGREGVPPGNYQFQMLYGIREQLWRDLAAADHRVRVLISYGPAWYPWYVRRLAERPANVWFVVRSMAG